MTQENFDLLNEVNEAQSSFKQYGKLTISTKLMLWRDKKLEEASRADFMRAEKGQRAIDTILTVDIQEFKPSLGFTYERKVRVGGLDWQKTLAPSIEAIYGKGSMSEAKKSETLMALNGKYVAVMDVPEQPRKNAAPDAKQYNTPKIIKVYASRDECLKDASEGFSTPSNGSVESDPLVPADYSKADWLSMKQDVVDAVNGAIAKAEAGAKGKPKPVVAKAVEAARAEALSVKAQELAATVEQVTALLSA